MLTPYMAGDTPPAPGTPSTSGSSSNYLASLSQNTGIPLTAQSASGGSQHFPYVYLGTKVKPNHLINVADPSGGKTGTQYSETHPTVASVQAKFAQSGDDNIRHWAYLLSLAGYVSGVNNAQDAARYAAEAPLADVYKLHLDFLYDAADQYGHGQKITPNQWLEQQLKYRLGDKWDGKLSSLTPGTAGSLGGSQAGTHTQTSKSVDFMSPDDAKNLVRGMLQQQLGRDPSQAEYEDFLATIHAAERSNPSVSKTTYTTDAEGRQVSSSTTTHGGLGAGGYEQLAYEKAKKLPSWAIWQAMGTYAPALFQALDAPVSGV